MAYEEQSVLLFFAAEKDYGRLLRDLRGDIESQSLLTSQGRSPV